MDECAIVVGKLNTTIKAQEVQLQHQTPASYASVAKVARAPVIKTKKPTRHSFIVSSTSCPGEEVKKLITSTIKPHDLKIGVRKLASLKTGNLLIECDTADQVTTLRKAIEGTDANLKTSLTQKKRPSMIVLNVAASMSDAEPQNSRYH